MLGGGAAVYCAGLHTGCLRTARCGAECRRGEEASFNHPRDRAADCIGIRLHLAEVRLQPTIACPRDKRVTHAPIRLHASEAAITDGLGAHRLDVFAAESVHAFLWLSASRETAEPQRRLLPCA